MKTALVRRPGPRLAEGIVTYLSRRAIDLARARRQWSAYVEALANAGWGVKELPPADENPDGVFVEDTMVLYGPLAIVARPAPPSRHRESEGVAEVLAALGYDVASIEPPATLEGGDVLQAGSAVYVGDGGRTNRAGIEQLRSLLAPLGAQVTGLPLGRVLHLKSSLSALPDGSLVGYRSDLPAPELLPQLRDVPEQTGAQVVVLDERRLLLSADCPRSHELYVELGFEPVVVDIGEFQKLEGAVTCLSVLADHRLR